MTSFTFRQILDLLNTNISHINLVSTLWDIQAKLYFKQTFKNLSGSLSNTKRFVDASLSSNL